MTTTHLIRAVETVDGTRTDVLVRDGVVVELGSGLSAARFRALPSETVVMHPGPMNRGLEISDEAADSPRSTVREQVANGVAVRMAVLYLTLAGDREDSL